MTRLQEFPWMEDSALDVAIPQPHKNHHVPSRINLYRIPWLKAMLENRWPQFLIRTVMLVGFVFTIATALLGSRVGSHNFAIIMVWIAWWTTLKLGFIPGWALMVQYLPHSAARGVVAAGWDPRKGETQAGA